MSVTYDDFAKLDIRIGRIVAVASFPQARKPAYKLLIDFGPEVGTKKSSAQITALYTAEALVGRYVSGVVNLAPKQIGPFVSECLTLGFANDDGEVVLAVPDKTVPLGSRLF